MAVASFYRKCKWINANGFSVSQVNRFSFFHNLQVGRAEECKATEEANVIDDYNEHNPFDFKKCHNIPDFKHIDTGDGFLIESDKIPALIKPKSISLGSEAFAPSPVEDLWKTFLDDTSKWFDHRKTKRNNRFPDFRHKYSLESLWIDGKRTPDWVLPRLKSLQDEAFAPSLSTEDLWKSIFVDPSKWHDYRKTKKSNKHPDFVHKDTTHGLWIEDMKNPPWITPMLEDLGDKAFAPFTSTEVLWKIFFDDPSRWFDYRKTKKSCKHPDFKHKENGEALWIEDSKTPDWVFAKLNDMWDEAFVSFQDIEDLWKFFFADPSKWMDYRKTKKNSNFPDFKHKKNGKAIWINDKRTPAWVLPKLNALKTYLSIENLWKSIFSDPSKWFDYRKIKKGNKCPDFVHIVTTNGLWVEAMETPSWIIPMLKQLPDESFAPAPSADNLWITLFNDPSRWFDNRKIKKSSKQPDFRHKNSGEALWIEDIRSPAWVFFAIIDLQDKAFVSSQFMEDLWKTFFADPSKWLDFRKIKKNKKIPDFRHKENGKVLWIENKRAPVWVLSKLNGIPDEAFASPRQAEELWISVFLDQSKWLDYRKIKINMWPDFVHRDTSEALWLEAMETPAWVTPMLNNLQNEAFACQDEVLASYEAKWKAFFSISSKWYDNRTSKKNPNSPDFKHKETGEGLWIASKLTPDWVVPNLSKLRTFVAPDSDQ